MNLEQQASGVFLVDKPAGISSAKCIARIKHSLKIKKLGHCGTLDPFATGLLICVANKATKLADTFQAEKKRYTGSILLGRTTDSDDITGNILTEKECLIEESKLQELLPNFMGEISQIPPQVSAIKVSGKRAYKLQRQGESFTLQARTVQVFSLEMKLINNCIDFDIACSKGFYVRSFARDLGEQLGCGACLASLRRLESGNFLVEKAKSPEKIDWSDLIEIDSEGLKQ